MHRLIKHLSKTGISNTHSQNIFPRTWQKHLTKPSLLVFCKVKLKQINHEIADSFTRRIMRIPEVTECYNTSGNYDYLLKVRAANMKQYQEFVLNKLGEIDSLASLESTFVMSEIKQDFGISI